MKQKLAKLDLQPNSIIVLTVETRDLSRDQATSVLKDATTSLAASQAKQMGVPVLICDDRIIPSALHIIPGQTLVFRIDTTGLSSANAVQYMQHVAKSMEAGFPNNKVLVIPHNVSLDHETTRSALRVDTQDVTEVAECKNVE